MQIFFVFFCIFILYFFFGRWVMHTFLLRTVFFAVVRLAAGNPRQRRRISTRMAWPSTPAPWCWSPKSSSCRPICTTFHLTTWRLTWVSPLPSQSTSSSSILPSSSSNSSRRRTPTSSSNISMPHHLPSLIR